jgi:hypothetical protein
MSTTVKTPHIATTPGAAQEFEPIAKNLTPQSAGQTTVGTPQHTVLSAYHTTSLQGLRPGIPPASTQPQPTTLHRALGSNAPSSGEATTGTVAGEPIKIHPDGAGGVIGRALGWCAGGAIAGSPAGPEGAGAGCAGGAIASLLNDLVTYIDQDPVQPDPAPPIDIPPSTDEPWPDQNTSPDDPPPAPSSDGPDDPPSTPISDGPDDPTSGPTCDGSDSDSGGGPRLDDDDPVHDED